MSISTHSLTGRFSYRELPQDLFQTLYTQHYPQVFSDTVAFNVRGALSVDEQKALEPVRATFANRYVLRIGVYDEHEHFVGWHVGVQDTYDRFYMMNTGILPAFQRQGIYTALLPVILGKAQEKGFQTVYSRHHADNNAVLIPKLKAGFVITGFEIADMHGVLVHLTYFFNPLRRQAIAFRTGHAIPGAELRKLIKLDPPQQPAPDT